MRYGPFCQSADTGRASSSSTTTSGSARVDHPPPRFYDAGNTPSAQIHRTRPSSARWLPANTVVYGVVSPVRREMAWRATIGAAGAELPGTGGRLRTQEGQPSSARLLFPAQSATSSPSSSSGSSSRSASPSSSGSSPAPDAGTALINALWAQEDTPMRIIFVPADHDFASPQDALDALELVPSVPWHQAAVPSRPASADDTRLPLDPRLIPAAQLPDADKTKLVAAWVAKEHAGHVDSAALERWQLDSMRLASGQQVSSAISRPPYTEHESDYPGISNKIVELTQAVDRFVHSEHDRIDPLKNALDDPEFHTQLRAAIGRGIAYRAWAMELCCALMDPLVETELGQQYLMAHMLPGLVHDGAGRQAVHDWYTRLSQSRSDAEAWSPDAWIETWGAATRPHAPDWERIERWNERANKVLEVAAAFLAAKARALSFLAGAFGRNHELLEEEVSHLCSQLFAPIQFRSAASTTVINDDGTELTTTTAILGPEHHELEEELEHFEAQLQLSTPGADPAQDTLAQADTRGAQQLEQQAAGVELHNARVERVVGLLRGIGILLSLRKLLADDDAPAGQDVWHGRQWQRRAEWLGLVGTVLQPAFDQHLAQAVAADTSILGRAPATVSAIRLNQWFGGGVAAIALGSSIWTFAQDLHNHADGERLFVDGLNIMSGAIAFYAAAFMVPPAGFALGIGAFAITLAGQFTDWFVTEYVPEHIWGEEAVQQGRMRYMAAHATPYFGGEKHILFSEVQRHVDHGHAALRLRAPYPYGYGNTLDPDGTTALQAIMNGRRLVCILRGAVLGSSVAFGSVACERFEPGHVFEYPDDAARQRADDAANRARASCVFEVQAFDHGYALVRLPRQLYPCTLWTSQLNMSETSIRRFETQISVEQAHHGRHPNLEVVAEVFDLPASSERSAADLCSSYAYGTLPGYETGRLVGRSEPMLLVPLSHSTGQAMWGRYALFPQEEHPASGSVHED